MSGIDFSVVTVSYNASKTIKRTINSVLSQTYSNIEYIVVDGGSTDGTLKILKSQGSKISFISENDQGIYDAMNKGVKLAQGKWIHILNADDWYPDPGVVERVVPHLDPARTNYFNILRVYSNGKTILQANSVQRWMLYLSAFLPHPGLIVSREQYDKIGLYDTNFKIASDHDFILRLTKDYPIKHFDRLLTCMDQGGVSSQNLELSAHEFLMVVERHGLPEVAVNMLARLRNYWWYLKSKSF